MYLKQSRVWEAVEFGGHYCVALLCSQCDCMELRKGGFQWKTFVRQGVLLSSLQMPMVGAWKNLCFGKVNCCLPSETFVGAWKGLYAVR